MDFEFSEPPGCVEGELGAAFVSARAFSDIGGTEVDPVPEFVSFLLDNWGSGTLLAGPALGLPGVKEELPEEFPDVDPPLAVVLALIVSVVAGVVELSELVELVLVPLSELSRPQPVTAIDVPTTQIAKAVAAN